MITSAVIQIGNTDDKLTQREWSNFVASMRDAIVSHAYRVHFMGGPEPFAPWQNCCWVCEVFPEQIEPLRAVITKVRKQYRQESAAVMFGNTEFI